MDCFIPHLFYQTKIEAIYHFHGYYIAYYSSFGKHIKNYRFFNSGENQERLAVIDQSNSLFEPFKKQLKEVNPDIQLQKLMLPKKS